MKPNSKSTTVIDIGAVGQDTYKNHSLIESVNNPKHASYSHLLINILTQDRLRLGN